MAITTHLAHRRQIYEFPNPFARHNYSAPRVAYNPPAHEVQWVVVKASRTEDNDDPANQTLQDLLQSGAWDTVIETETLVLLHRR